MENKAGCTFGVKEACDYLGCSERWLREQVKKGAIPYYKIGSRIRFTDITLTKWIQAQERKHSKFRA